MAEEIKKVKKTTGTDTTTRKPTGAQIGDPGFYFELKILLEEIMSQHKVASTSDTSADVLSSLQDIAHDSIASPMLAFENALSRFTKLQVRIFIDVFADLVDSKSSDSGKSMIERTLNTSMLFTVDGGGKKLNLSNSMKFLVPFVDVNWHKETHENNVLNYLISLIGFDENHETYDFPVIIGTPKRKEKSSGPFVNQHDPAKMPEGMPFACYAKEGEFGAMKSIANDNSILNKPEKGTLIIKDIIYTKEGVWFNIHCPRNKPLTVSLCAADGSKTSFTSPPSSDGQHKFDPFEACFLPYPPILNEEDILGNKVDPLDYYLEIRDLLDPIEQLFPSDSSVYIFKLPQAPQPSFMQQFMARLGWMKLPERKGKIYEGEFIITGTDLIVDND